MEVGRYFLADSRQVSWSKRLLTGQPVNGLQGSKISSGIFHDQAENFQRMSEDLGCAHLKLAGTILVTLLVVFFGSTLKYGINPTVLGIDTICFLF